MTLYLIKCTQLYLLLLFTSSTDIKWPLTSN